VSGPPRSPHAAIVRELRERFGPAPAGPAVTIYLAARGYDPGQIAAVLAELAGAPPGGSGAADEVPGPAGPEDAAGVDSAPSPARVALRAWGAHERARFTPEAWGRLLQLRAAGMGDPEFEHLVDRALLTLDGPVTLAELRALLGDALGPGDAPPDTIH
jgi:hypothetical protein